MSVLADILLSGLMLILSGLNCHMHCFLQMLCSLRLKISGETSNLCLFGHFSYKGTAIFVIPHLSPNTWVKIKEDGNKVLDRPAYEMDMNPLHHVSNYHKIPMDCDHLSFQSFK